MVHAYAFVFQPHPDPAVAEPTSLAGDLLHFLADIGIVRWALVPDGSGVDTDKPTRPAPRDIMIPHHPERRISPLCQCRRLFP